jgi:hypothetical protein
MDVTLFKTFSHMIIMTRKVDLFTEKGAGILIKESSIKVIDSRRDSGKAQLINLIRKLYKKIEKYHHSSFTTSLKIT